MPRPASAAARRLPTLLLLGLLALLLWGQCALLFPGTPTPPPTLEGLVAHTDSLRDAPSTLFLTLQLHNTIQVPVTVQEVRGSLRFGNRDFPFSATPALHGRQLLVFEALTQAVAVPLALRADSLALLRAALQPTAAGGLSRPTLRWQVRYTWVGARAPYALGRTSIYLPPLAQQP